MSVNKAEIAGNYATSGGTGDPEYVANQLADMQAEQQAAQEETAEYDNVRARLEQKQTERATRTVQVVGEPVEFTRPASGEIRDAINLRTRATNGDEDAEAELFDYVFSFLAEHSTDPGMDEAFWGGFEIEVLMGVYEDLALGN